MTSKINWKVAKKLNKKVFSDHKDINPAVLQLLFNRGVFSVKDSVKKRSEKIDKFISPNYEKLNDPFLLKDMKKVVSRINKAIDKNEKIAIFGDYDADGVTASAVLFETIKYLGNKPVVYIPHRDKEGYGLNPEAVKSLYKDKVDLIITVDCGIINNKEVEVAKKLGIDVIITDHHEPSDNLPKAFAVVDPKVKNEKYPFDELAGVGVSFKVAQALVSKSSKKEEGDKFLKWLLDLVAIGSIGDMVPLIDENRTLVSYGSIVFAKTRRLGLKELKKASSFPGIKSIDFVIAPRLNAAGRMDHASWAFNLVTTESKVEAFQLLKRIERLNNERRELTERIVKEVREEVEPFLPEEKIIIVSNKNWPASVSGIVASRLVNEYNVPAMVVEDRGKIMKGSARSPKNINIIKALRSINELFVKLGGHKNASGFTYEKKNHDKIIKMMGKISKEFKVGGLGESLEIDMELDLDEITLGFYKETEKLEPFGYANSRPIYMTKNVEIINMKRVGNNSHLKVWFRKDNKRREAIAFRKGNLIDEFKIGQILDVSYRLGENEYRGMKSLQFEIVDLK